MENLVDSFAGFLLASSGFLLAFGVLSWLILKIFHAGGKARLFICSLLVILPLAYPVGSLVPEHHKIVLPAEKLKNIFPDTIESGKNTIASSMVHFYGSSEIHEAGNDPSGGQVSLQITSKPGTLQVFFGAINYKQVILLIWIVLFTLLLLRSFLILKKIKLLVRCADEVTDPDILSILQQCKTETGLRRCPRLLVVDHMLTPMVVGFFHSAVILPKRLSAPEFREGLRFTLLHELKHLQRRENWWLLFESLVGAMYFFHPVIYWAKWKIHEEWEHICDRHVIQVTNKPASYAEFLLHEIRNLGNEPSPSLAAPLIFKTRKTSKRVLAILNRKNPTLFTKIKERAAIATVFACFISFFLFAVTPLANVNKEEIEHRLPEQNRFKITDSVPQILEVTSNEEPVSINNDSGFESMELQSPKPEIISEIKAQSAYAVPKPPPFSKPDTYTEESIRQEKAQYTKTESPNASKSKKRPIASPIKEETPSIETKILTPEMAANAGTLEENGLLSGNDSLSVTSGLLSSLSTESLLEPQELSLEFLEKAEKESAEPDRHTVEEPEDDTQNRPTTDRKREPASDNVSIPMGARIIDWKVIDDKNIIIVTQFYGSFKATLTNEYPKLSAYSNKLGFASNWPYALDVNSSIILTNGDECRVQKLVPYSTKRRNLTKIF